MCYHIEIDKQQLLTSLHNLITTFHERINTLFHSKTDNMASEIISTLPYSGAVFSNHLKSD